jgi:hypothetical protein
MKAILFLLVPALGLIACNRAGEIPSGETVRLEEMDWLLGKWVIQGETRRFHENWYRANDTLYQAVSYMLHNGDTVFREDVQLIEKGNDLWYIPAVSNQNQGEPVLFRLTGVKNGEYVFENPEHDFPQRIIYSHPHPDSLHARIEGGQDSTYRKQEFFMAKTSKSL